MDSSGLIYSLDDCIDRWKFHHLVSFGKRYLYVVFNVGVDPIFEKKLVDAVIVSLALFSYDCDSVENSDSEWSTCHSFSFYERMLLASRYLILDRCSLSHAVNCINSLPTFCILSIV